MTDTKAAAERLTDRWLPMDTSPKSGPVVEVLLRHQDGTIHKAHWAYGDGDGLMPPFGPAWFEKVIDKHSGRCMYCREITGPFSGWRHCNEP